DQYLEIAKQRTGDGEPALTRDSAAFTALTTLDILLRLLHPLMPFVTEEAAQHLAGAAATLQQRSWPEAPVEWHHQTDEGAAVAEVLELVRELRATRQEHGISANDRDRHALRIEGGATALAPQHRTRIVEALVPVMVGRAGTGDATTVVAGTIQARLYLESGSRNLQRLDKRLAQLEQQIARYQSQLANEGFVHNAPSQLVQQTKSSLAEAEQRLGALKESREGAN